MRYFSCTSSSRDIFLVEGLSSFPGEITFRLIQLFELEHERAYTTLYRAVYEGRSEAWKALSGHLVTPSEYTALRNFRQFLLRAERQRESLELVHSIHNLNTGVSLVFIAE